MMCGAFLFRRLKLANFAAIAAISAVAMPVQAETASLEGRTAIVTPLSLVKIDDLKFGTIISSPVAGTVTISPEDGSRDSTGGVTLIGSSHSRAKIGRTRRAESARAHSYISNDNQPCWARRFDDSYRFHYRFRSISQSDWR